MSKLKKVQLLSSIADETRWALKPKKKSPTFLVILANPAKSGIALQTRSTLGQSEEEDLKLHVWLKTRQGRAH